MKKSHPLFIKFSQVQQFTLKEISAWSVKYIRPGSSVLTDGLRCFPGVTAADCTHDKVITFIDGRYANGDMIKWLNIILGNVKNAIRGIFDATWQNFATDSIGIFAWTPWSSNWPRWH